MTTELRAIDVAIGEELYAADRGEAGGGGTVMMGRTERLVFEPLSLGHADGLFAALRHDIVDRFLPAPDVTSIDALRERIARLAS
jgi:hypothetical protein